MRFRLPLLISALISAFAFPGVAQAQVGVPGLLPCIDVVVVTVNCVPPPQPQPVPQPQPQPAPQPQPQSAGTCPGRDLVPTAANTSTIRRATLCLLNEQRAKRGLRALKPAPALQQVATAYAKRMVRERFFKHTSPEGETFVSRIKRSSYLRGNLKRWAVGEAIGWGSSHRSSPGGIVRAWMRSSGHRRTILDRRFNEVGLGIALGAPKRGVDDASAATYVNEFGRRRR